MKDNHDGLSNRFNSYQQQPPYPSQSMGGMGGNINHTKNPNTMMFVAEQQTNILSDTLQTQYQTEETANAVMNQLHAQRQQIQGANENVWDMRQATEQTKKELRDLQSKYREKKRTLYIWIALLGTIDFLLFIRLLKCGGSFFC